MNTTEIYRQTLEELLQEIKRSRKAALIKMIQALLEQSEVPVELPWKKDADAFPDFLLTEDGKRVGYAVRADGVPGGTEEEFDPASGFTFESLKEFFDRNLGKGEFETYRGFADEFREKAAGLLAAEPEVLRSAAGAEAAVDRGEAYRQFADWLTPKIMENIPEDTERLVFQVTSFPGKPAEVILRAEKDNARGQRELLYFTRPSHSFQLEAGQEEEDPREQIRRFVNWCAGDFTPAAEKLAKTDLRVV